MSISDVISGALTDTGGAAGVEFALMAPALILFVIGVVDVGALAYEKAEVAASANAGALYAIHNTSASTSAIQSAVQNATPLGTAVTATATQVYYCASGGTLTTAASASASCSGGGTAGTYIQVNAQAPYTTLISWAGISMPATLAAQALVRTQ